PKPPRYSGLVVCSELQTARPCNPGKAHFRSAAVGGAPHFVRRKKAALPLFYTLQFDYHS
ncbi:MAG: hypothetical protein FWF81_03560, partial [Defluviitaleaceae bacterium]|nr:hypothetical protein [Defluviitaleaceae bacterium]